MWAVIGFERKVLGQGFLWKTTRDHTLWQFWCFLSRKKSSAVQFAYFQTFFGRKLRANKTIHNMIFGDSRSQRQSFSPFTTRRSNKIVFATHPCDHVQASCLPHERFSGSFSLSPSSGAGKREPRALSWLDLTIAEIFCDARRNEISGTQEIRLRYAHDSRESIVCAKRQQTNLLHERVLIANKAQRKIKTSKRAKELYWHYTATN